VPEEPNAELLLVPLEEGFGDEAVFDPDGPADEELGPLDPPAESSAARTPLTGATGL